MAEAEQARHVDQDAGLLLGEGVEAGVAEVDKGADVQRHQLLQPVGILVPEGAVGADASIVDESRCEGAPRLELGAERLALAGDSSRDASSRR